MSIPQSSAASKLLFWLLLFSSGLLVANVVLALSPNLTPAYTPDSISYLLASRELRAGNGLVLPDFSLFDPRFHAFTVWPPLYPLVLATGLNPFFIQAALLGLSAVVAYFALVKIARLRPMLAVLGAAAAMLGWPLLVDASYVWSEPLAIFFVLLALTAFAAALDDFGYSWKLWVVGACALAAAVYTRYAMLVFVPSVMFAMLWLPLSWRRRGWLIIATPVAVGVLIGPLLIWNVVQSGHLSGGVRGPSTDTLGHLLPITALRLSSAFAGGGNEQAILVVCVIGAVVAAVYWWKMGSEAGVVRSSSRLNWFALLAAVMAVGYALGILSLRLWKNFDQLDTRLISPAVPLIALALVVWCQSIWLKSNKNALWERFVLVAPLLGLISLLLFTSFQEGTQAWRNWRLSGSPQWHSTTFFTYTNLAPYAVPRIDGVVLYDRPAILAFRTGWDVRRIPRAPWSQDGLKRIADSASGVVIDDRRSLQLARALKDIVPQLHEYKLRGALLLTWGIRRLTTSGE